MQRIRDVNWNVHKYCFNCKNEKAPNKRRLAIKLVQMPINRRPRKILKTFHMLQTRIISDATSASMALHLGIISLAFPALHLVHSLAHATGSDETPATKTTPQTGGRTHENCRFGFRRLRTDHSQVMYFVLVNDWCINWLIQCGRKHKKPKRRKKGRWKENFVPTSGRRKIWFDTEGTV